MKKIFPLCFAAVIALGSAPVFGANSRITLGHSHTETDLYHGWKLIQSDDRNAMSADFTGGEAVNVPHDWQIHQKPNPKGNGAQGFLDRSGVAWYRTEIELPAEIAPDKCFQIAFDSVFEKPEVYVNGELVGSWHYGYMSFYLDITKFLKPGKNVIAVRVDNTDPRGSRWYSGAGIIGKVRFIETGAVHIDEYGINVLTDVNLEKNTATVQVSVDTLGEGKENAALSASLSFDGQSINLQGKPGDTKLVFRVKEPALWSADKPNLYELTLRLTVNGKETDCRSCEVGIRKVEFRPGKGLFVNGKSELLKGGCIHHDGGAIGAAMSEWSWRSRLTAMKEVGFNAIRCSHNPFPPMFYDLCDELGFYVIDEVWDKWDYPYVINDWERILTQFLRRDARRACVILWSIGNEVSNQGSPAMIETLKKFTDFVKLHEPTRPVSCALSPWFPEMPASSEADTRPNQIRAIDAILPHVSLLLLNYQEHWFGRILEAHPDICIVSSESYQYFAGDDTVVKGFQEKPAWMFVEEYPAVCGSFLWSGVAYVGESIGFPCRGWPAALIQTNNQRRPASYLFQSYWRSEPMVHLSILDDRLGFDMEKYMWGMPKLSEHWNYQPHEMLEYMVFSNCDEIQISNSNRDTYTKKRPADYPNRIVRGFMPYPASGFVKVVGFRDGKKVAEHTIRSEKEPVKLEASSDRRRIHSDIYDHCFIQIHAKDAAGVKCFQAVNPVKITVEGPAELVAVDNGNLVDNFPFNGDTVPLFRGGATAIVRATGNGDITITAESAGLKPAVVKISSIR